MTAYHWHPQRLGEVFVLPAAVVDQALALATSEQIRVLLWFSRHGQKWDAAACAKDLKRPAKACESDLYFWVEQGMLQVAGEEAPAPVKTYTARPAPIKPLTTEVLAYQKEHPDFSAFLETASACLGKPLSHGDVATLLYLQTTAGLPESVILLEIGYAVSLGKANMRYVEKIALAWADEDLTDMESVDGRIKELQRQRNAADQVEAALLVPRPLTAAQVQMADRWVNTWGFTMEMIQHADTITRENTGKFQPAYTDKILERWYAEGIDAPNKIPAPITKKKGAAATNPEQGSLDVEGFEQQLMQYRPKYHKTNG